MIEFKMPSLGADMEAGTLVEWFKQPGDRVQRGDVIALVETQKGAIEIEVFNEGLGRRRPARFDRRGASLGRDDVMGKTIGRAMAAEEHLRVCVDRMSVEQRSLAYTALTRTGVTVCR
ncbi:biotin/lipoyl-containing protein [Sinorhizobium fredii]|uniref:biotin/lipoyl-containing protein n=1 Tax=Rhizobium fredii TaxID=380 RepID=UPI003518EA79